MELLGVKTPGSTDEAWSEQGLRSPASYGPGNASRVLSGRAEKTTPPPSSTRRDSPPCSPCFFIFRLRGLYTYTRNPVRSGIPHWRWATASQVVREPQQPQELAQISQRRRVLAPHAMISNTTIMDGYSRDDPVSSRGIPYPLYTAFTLWLDDNWSTKVGQRAKRLGSCVRGTDATPRFQQLG
jgi:hypothetical protein